MNRRKLAWRFFRWLRTLAWGSPLARRPFWAEVFMRIGYRLRRWMGIVPGRDEIAEVHGHRMRFGAASECYGDMVNDAYEPHITRMFEELLQPGMGVVDVGAHIGYFTLLAARQVGPEGRVYAFEPAPANYEILRQNIALNEYRNITATAKAVCDAPGTTRFFMQRDTVGHSLYPTTIGRGKTAIDVETTSLDDFFAKVGWPEVHLIKMDIEGAEAAALAGMERLAGRSRRLSIVMEFIPHIQRQAGVDPRELLRKLKEMGFTTRILTDDGLGPLDEMACDIPNLYAALYCEKNGAQSGSARVR